MVDIQRPSSVARQRRIRRVIYGALLVAGLALVTVLLSRLQPAAPGVDRASVWFDTVKRGPMVRQVRGLGTLVPEDIRWIPAVTEGRVERILVHPGTAVQSEMVLLELSNPEVQQRAFEAESQLRSAEANLALLQVQLRNELLQQQAAAASVNSDYEQARYRAEADAALAAEGLASELTTRLSKISAEGLAARRELEQKRLESISESSAARLSVQKEEVQRLRASYLLRRQQADSLIVKAGTAGVLQQVPVEVGQRIGPGTNLARVADPTRLKAELRIPETQAKDIEIGQVASVDTRNGIIPARVSRIDPAAQGGSVTVDVALQGALPRGARPDLSVDGTVELERIADALIVRRPAFGQEHSVISLFRMEKDGQHAVRVKVRLGRTSVNDAEVLEGLNEGDQVILTDMSAYDAFDRVRLR
jgi:HlyD family secretion protein